MLGPVVLLLLGALASPGAAPSPLHVTYVANEGFLISAGGATVAVDALFHGESINWCHVPTEATAGLMASASPPFDAIDLVLVTHWHSDHLTAQLLMDHMKANGKARLVASPQAVAKMRELPGFDTGMEKRIHVVDLPLLGMEEVTVGPIRVEAHRIRHGAYMIQDEPGGERRNKHAEVENLAFVVEMGGRSFVHFGDAFLRENLDYFDGERFKPRKVDVAFLEGWSDETLEALNANFSPGTTVFMHMPPDPEKVEAIAGHVGSKLPGSIVFRGMMESRTLP